MAVLEHRVNPIPVVRRWAREFLPSRPTARLEIGVVERACSLRALLAAAPGVSVLEDMLLGAFRLFVATGAAELRASIFNTPHGPRNWVPALLEALRWRYPGEMSACQCWRPHWSKGADAYCTRFSLRCGMGAGPSLPGVDPHAGLGSGAVLAVGLGGGMCGGYCVR